MSSFDERQVECIKTFTTTNKQDDEIVLFKKGELYLARFFGITAVVKDETGCFRALIDAKSDKFYKEYFKQG